MTIDTKQTVSIPGLRAKEDAPIESAWKAWEEPPKRKQGVVTISDHPSAPIPFCGPRSKRSGRESWCNV